MMNLAEYRRPTTRLADFLPWAALVDEGVVLNKDGSFQRTARFRGPDLDSAVPAELVAVAGRLNNASAASGIGLGGLRRSPAPSRLPLSRKPLSRRRVGPRRSRAQGGIRRGRRSLRVQLFPDIPLFATSRRRRPRRAVPLRGP